MRGGCLTNVEAGCDLFVPEALAYQLDHLPLTLGDRGDFYLFRIAGFAPAQDFLKHLLSKRLLKPEATTRYLADGFWDLMNRPLAVEHTSGSAAQGSFHKARVFAAGEDDDWDVLHFRHEHEALERLELFIKFLIQEVSAHEQHVGRFTANDIHQSLRTFTFGENLDVRLIGDRVAQTRERERLIICDDDLNIAHMPRLGIHPGPCFSIQLVHSIDFLDVRLDAKAVQLVGLMLNKAAIPFITNHLRRRTILAVAGLLLIAPCRNNSLAGDAERGSEGAKSAFDFVNSIGVNTHLSYFDTEYGNFALVERELKSIGILHVRDGIHLQNADYNRALYGRWNELGKAGVRFDAVLDPRNNLGALNASLLNEVNQLAGQGIEAFEGANEFDVSHAPDWVAADRRYQEDIYRSVKAMAGGQAIRVIGASMASASDGSQVGDMSDRIDDGNLHPYPAGKMPSIVFPEQTELAAEVSGDKEVVFTETGYHNALHDHSDQPAISEAAAAKYIPRLFLEDYAHGIPRTYLYEFMDEEPDMGLDHFQMHWGLIRADGSEKPAFAAVKNLIEELSDSGRCARLEPLDWRLSGDEAHIHHLLLEKANGEFDLILWQEIPSYNTGRQVDIVNEPEDTVLTLGRKARSVTLYEPAAQRQPVSAFAGVSKLPLQIPDHPVVVKIVF